MNSYYGMQVMIIQKVLIIIPKKGNAKEQDPEGVEQTNDKEDQHSDSQDNEQADNKNK